MRTFLLTALATLAPAHARTDELKRERLPADVDFVVHLDLDSFKKTELWRHVSTVSQGHLEIDDDFEEIKTRFGIDPFTDFRAVTLFKVKDEEEPTVVLFATSANLDKALREIQSESEYARIVEGGIELHSWKDDDGEENDGETYGYIHTISATEKVIVLAGNRASALHAARVLRGEEPNHAKAGTLLTLRPAPGSFLYAAAASIPELQNTPASQVFGLAQGIQVDLGEAGGFLNAHMGVTTKSPQDALHISNVVQGLVSLASLAGSEAEELVELLSGLRLNASGSEVWLDFSFGVQRLIQIMEDLDDDDDDGESK